MEVPSTDSMPEPHSEAPAEPTAPSVQVDDLERLADQLEPDQAAVIQATIRTLTEHEEALDQAAREQEQLHDQLLRHTAEFRNYRRRTDEELKLQRTLGKTGVVKRFLGLYDDFRRSVEAVEQAEAEQAEAYPVLKEGLDMVWQKFTTEFEQLGVEAIEAVGQPFDEALHEALMQQPAPEGVEPGTILQEVQKGYRLGDRILRHSQVIVAA